ncbi:MAG: EamA family transporter [SAR324 cluster bacterium]|nr:EamA family transporter [SAR324 cluster bacterium]
MWFVLALASGLFQVLRNMTMKRIGHALDDTINVWGRFAFLVPFAAVVSAWHGIPEIGEGFWWTCLFFGITQTAATLSLSRALKVSDISLVTPIWKLSLILVVVYGFLWLDETPSLAGAAGVAVSLGGVYLINAERTRTSLWAPLLAIVTDPGQRYTLLSAAFLAPSVVLMKQLVLSSDPYFGTLIAYLFATAVITPYTLYRSGKHFASIARFWMDFLALGAFAAVSILLTAVAYTLTLSSYVEAVKQVEILFALAVGYLVFHERARVRAIWPGSLTIMAGAAIIRLWG